MGALCTAPQICCKPKTAKKDYFKKSIDYTSEGMFLDPVVCFID
jgi:hypothetical protein